MRSGEKYFEQLSESEKDVFGLCSEVTKWSDPVYLRRYPGVLELREEATRLYGEISQMDYVNDDRYYQISAKAESLRSKFEALKKEIDTKKEQSGEGEPFQINIEGVASVEDIMATIIEKLGDNKSVVVTEAWIPEEPGYEGDNLFISVEMPPVLTEYCERIYVHENFPTYYLEGEPILQKISETKIGESLNIKIYKHEDRDQLELRGLVADVPTREALKIIEAILKLAEKGRQLKPGKEAEYKEAIEDAIFNLQHPDW